MMVAITYIYLLCSYFGKGYVLFKLLSSAFELIPSLALSA